MNVYTDGKKHIKEQFRDRKLGMQRARRLRQIGWTATCRKLDLTDLAREVIYIVEASQ